MSTFNRIAVYGHRGWASSAIMNALIAVGGPVTVLHRSDSDTSALPIGTPTREIDLQDSKSICNALKDIDILISLVGQQNINHQLALIGALPHTDVRLFVPSDLAYKISEEQMLIPSLKAKVDVEKAAEIAGIQTTVIRPGNFVESTFATTLLGIDVQGNRLVYTGNSEHESLNLCTRDYVAAAYAAIFPQTPIAKLGNRNIGLRELTCTGSEVAATLQRRHGMHPKVFRHGLEQTRREIEARIEKGDLTALAFSYRYPWGAGQQVKLVGDDIWDVQGYSKTTLEEVIAESRLGTYKELPPTLGGQSGSRRTGLSPNSCGQDQYWKRISGMEYLTASPTKIPRIKEFIKSILADSKLKESDDSHAISSQKDDMNKDAPGSLPGELMTSVLECLDYDNLCAIRLASRSAVNETSQTDWFKLYKAMRAISKGQDLGHPFTTAGLHNRSRLWGVCSRILEEYWPRKIAHDQELSDKSVVLKKVKNTIQPIMRYPYEPSLIWSTIGLVHTFVDGTRNSIGSKDIFTTSDDVQIPKKGWIIELVIITKEEIDEENLNKIVRKIVGLRFIFSRGDPVLVGQAEGDVRTIYPDSGHFVVGLQLAWAARKPISKIALLFQPMKKAPQDSIDRLKPRIVLDEAGVPIAPMNPETAGHLWKNDSPPKELDVVLLRTGFVTPDNTKDDTLVHVLVFGTTESDLGMISAIGVDAQLRGFEVCLDNGHEKWTRAIGHRNAMQYLSIDGRGGERILYFYVNFYDVARGIRFVTNRERHLIVGEPGSRDLRFPPEEPQYRFDSLMGIYCHWSNRNTPGTDLTCVGAFSRKFSPAPTRPPNLPKDARGRYWTPNPPPRGIKEVGTIYGKREFKNRFNRVTHIPSEDATVSWLDCSRPIESIKAGLCHGAESAQLPLLSLSFKYADDQTTPSFGPTEFSSPKDTLGVNRNHWCWWVQGLRRDNELEEHCHYTQDEWNIERSYLKFVPLWIGGDGALTGLRFITQDGKQSPAWGYCVGARGAKPVKLPLQAQNRNRAAGLKLFIDSINREVTREDFVVVAVQLVGFNKV
ncbi:hypothetical protein FSARC_4459 [Fusarium sarcochroum]|uniref:NmrA-like domain-containing protein n=1 Tax=Fusarium sarcochroum TaxID=1208366 RepID=A0A8H4U1L5_9HYPO|nr:hypothetical protein FSARC_4459 [Fusarium sarcochroum]